MKNRRLRSVGIALLCMALGATIARADLITEALKIGGISLVISKFGGRFNDALNKLMDIPTNDPKFSTKVVPIVTVGKGTAIGAVQVAGPRASVEKCKAVAQLETKVLGVRLRALVPIEAVKVTNVRRIDGVGVSGIVDVKM
jgi:hypothetical protein